jgi:hypothetical protein
MHYRHNVCHAPKAAALRQNAIGGSGSATVNRARHF